ncbi:MAG: ABC transporter permease [Spirochaetaceae bacterium]|jgi:AI-2 transport system permease protein|nr:ABC transporter permease [Spirochaetaceae bacterium]
MKAPKNLLGIIFRAREITSLSFVAALFIIVGFVNPGFLSPDNLLLTLNSSVVFALLAAGTAFIIITGEIDVSIGAVMGLCAAVSGSMIRDGSSWALAVGAALLVGVASGAVNGAGHLFLKIPSIIMTLGTMGVIRGLIYVFTGGRWVENVPSAFKSLSQVNVAGVSVFYWGALAVFIAGSALMKRTRRGQFFAAIGDNTPCAVMLGIPVRGMKMLSFIIAGVFYAAAGVMFVSRTGFVTPVTGSGYEMKAIAACVLGGVSLSGGVGSLLGAAVGALFMASVGRILVFLNSSADDDVITGVMLIVIVVADALIQQRTVERSRRQRLLAKTRAGGEPKEADHA